MKTIYINFQGAATRQTVSRQALCFLYVLTQTNSVNMHVILNWVFTLRENQAPCNLLCKMAAACTRCVNHVRCCSCLFNKEQTWSKSSRNSPKFIPTTWSLLLEQGWKKNAGEKGYKFFREGYVKARCYRSLRKSEEPHF